MAKKVFNMQGGNHSAAALSAFFNAALYGDVASGLKVVPTGTTGASVRVEVGTGQIDTGQGFSRIIQIDTAETVPLTAASPANSRRDLIVAYIDNTVTPTLSVVDNINGVLKFIAVSGNPSATPADPSASTIQAAVGPGNPYITLGRVRVAPSATSFAVGDIDDLRKLVTLLPGRINSSDMINDGIIVSSKINFATFGNGNYSLTEKDTGFTWVDGKPIFKRTFTGVISAGANTVATTNIIASGAGFSQLIRSYGTWRKNATENIVFSGGWNGTNIAAVNWNQSTGNVQIISSADSARTAAPYQVTLEYTKV